MSNPVAQLSLDDELPPPPWGGQFGAALRRLLCSRAAVFSLLVITLFCAAALLAPSLAPHDPLRMGWGKSNQPPAWLVGGSPDHILGTDASGRDTLSRLIYGARTALGIALPAAALAALIGVLVGVTAGFYGGWIDGVLMRLTDIFSAFPTIMASVLLVFVLRDTPFGNWQNGRMTMIIAFALVAWVAAARLTRAAALTARQELYIEAAHATGVPRGRILLRHILPASTGLLMVWLTTAIPRAIILEALLGYVGIRLTAAGMGAGAEFYVTSWGGLFYSGRIALRSNPTLLIAPSLCVIIIAVAFTLLGDRMRDALDPRLKNMV